MITLGNIKEVISSEFNSFEEQYAVVFQTDNALLQSVFDHVLQGKGKQIRPMLVLLSAKLCGAVNKQTIDAAIALELLHTATLIHDDVVDETYQRRGNPSVNAKWDNKISILSGDYMLSNALYVAVKTGSLQILGLISSIGKELADGELLQLFKTQKSVMTEADYYQIIRKKTAMLFAVCTASGAISVDADAQTQELLYNFGENLGICFQMQDDIFDYSENTSIGKPVGNDIREGKITLPLILALENADQQSKKIILKIIEDKDFTSENVEKILCFTREFDGIALAHAQMEVYRQKAIQMLSSFKDSDEKTALFNALEYAMNRNK
jgi:octaprenyl-diphosphate synthase